MPSKPGAANAPWRLGERFFLPVAVTDLMHPPRVGAPSTRSLWVYAIDPAEIGLQQLGTALHLNYERLAPGPVGARFRVEPSDPVPLRKRHHSKHKPAADPQPLNLEDPVLAASGGLSPTTADPQFAAQMTYAVCEHVYATFARALGRQPHFGPWQARAIAEHRPHQLTIRPHAMKEDNAYYSADVGSLDFGYFLSERRTQSALVSEGSLQQYALSRDIISHELTHALLDGLRSRFLEDGHPDIAAFHEGFSDLIAIFQRFTCAPLVQQAIEETGGIGVRALLDFGRQLGESDHSAGGQAMRSLLSVLGGVHTKSSAWAAHQEALSAPLDKSQVLRGNAPEECHDRGAILVAAVVEAFLTVFERRARTIRRLAQVIAPTDTRGLPSELVDLLVELVLKIADQFLRLIIRAVDYCPPVDLRFGDYLRALITADTELVPDDPHDYRGALVRAFRRRGVEIDHVLDMSTQSLLWADASMYAIVVPELAFSRIKRSNDGRRAVDQNEMQRWARALGEKVCDEQHIASFGLRAPGGRYSEIVIESLHVVHRIGPEGHVLRGMIAEIVQTYRSEKLSVSGGCTVHLNENGLVRYIIRKRADSVRRRKAISTFLRHGEVIDFEQVHAKRGLAWGR